MAIEDKLRRAGDTVKPVCHHVFAPLAWRKKGFRLQNVMSGRSYVFDGAFDGAFDGPVIVVHTAAQARAALAAAARAGKPVVLASPRDASASMGAGLFRAIVAAAREAEPHARSLAVLDCGNRPGDAMAALREGIEAVCFRGDAEVAAKLSEMAEQSGAHVIEALTVALDLSQVSDPEAALRACLAG